MPDGIITILDEIDKKEIVGDIADHVSAENPHNISTELIGAATPPIITSISLMSSLWNKDTFTQTVSVNGVLADETKQIINVSPAGASTVDVANAMVYCSGQGANSLVFSCVEIPKNNIVFNISIQNAIYV